VLLLASLFQAPDMPLATPPANASEVRLHYEDTFDDVEATEETAAEIKAAFLMRFPDFVVWQNAPEDTLRIGVVGDDVLHQMLMRLASQENNSGLGAPHVIAISQISDAAPIVHCQILVMGEDTSPDLLDRISDAHEAGVLTVGVWSEARDGAIIRLFREGDRVRFDISRTLAKKAGLRISSKLLMIARKITRWIGPDSHEPHRG